MWVKAKVIVDSEARVASVNIDNPSCGGAPDFLDWPTAMPQNHPVAIEWMGKKYSLYADGASACGGAWHVNLIDKPRLPPPPVTDDGAALEPAPAMPEGKARRRG